VADLRKLQSRPITSIEDAMKGADVLIALSTPGPDVIKPAWVKTMAPKSIVSPVRIRFRDLSVCCEGSGRIHCRDRPRDFPNQVNNSLGFPGILKGTLIVKASKITDNMAIAAAYSIATTAEKRGITPENIVPLMSEWELFPAEARDVAVQAMADGVAR